MKTRLLKLTGTLVLAASATFSAAQSCPDTSDINNAPPNPAVNEVRFRKWTNSWLSAWYSPYHMVHDAVVKEGDASTIVGKFDYDWALHKDLEGEYIAVFIYGTGMNQWENLGTYRTDSDGKIYVPTGTLSKGQYRVRMVVKGDLSAAEGYLTVAGPETKTVLFDIDGTLTISDFEAVGDYLGINTAQSFYYAPETVNAYREKGYCIAYLSARPYWLMKDTREWLALKNIPLLHAHTNPNAELFEEKDTAAYKADYINHLQANGLTIVRAYGNASTDIAAYAAAGIPKSETYIIGENAGKEGTQTLTSDYSHHYSTVVVNTPNAQ